MLLQRVLKLICVSLGQVDPAAVEYVCKPLSPSLFGALPFPPTDSNVRTTRVIPTHPCGTSFSLRAAPLPPAAHLG
ncbi:hypothetical protein PILCRDRAFT_811643 [Piloderma croceum F 1598]|uniref:Secreted protein n=1 Tax=Piloderma croceum (strain F 1598) TaxID=765440 RepID=A0A0C3GHL8_PILCF|nr:hypothetical protein PILCRDRAFT_811643 [Piloderma croceum F 1598]